MPCRACTHRGAGVRPECPAVMPRQRELGRWGGGGGGQEPSAAHGPQDAVARAQTVRMTRGTEWKGVGSPVASDCVRDKTATAARRWGARIRQCGVPTGAAARAVALSRDSDSDAAMSSANRVDRGGVAAFTHPAQQQRCRRSVRGTRRVWWRPGCIRQRRAAGWVRHKAPGAKAGLDGRAMMGQWHPGFSEGRRHEGRVRLSPGAGLAASPSSHNRSGVGLLHAP